ncbi:MAG: fibrobacter succinogenes major paralogous domain-containing protein [Bacteroidota bacterium]|nr:fibrobacter succinogenes major paralogous domain-containing protein [Bacteroidota bacterium]
MRRKYLNLLVLITSLSIVSTSCSKDNDKSDDAVKIITTAKFNPNVSYGNMTDQDGNIYKTITIGTQTWMAENLRTTTYNDGTSIPIVTEDNKWEALTTGAYCNYNNTIGKDTIATYGHLYNWYAVNTGKLAPIGWHVPSDAEWGILIAHLGNQDEAGNKLSETGTTHWNYYNKATNECGFTALPGGKRFSHGSFSFLGTNGFWWSSTTNNSYSIDYSWFVLIDANQDVSRNFTIRKEGFSVRCIRD